MSVPASVVPEAAKAPPPASTLTRSCPHCAKVLELPQEFAGRPVACPACEAAVPPAAAELVEVMEYAQPSGHLTTALGWGISLAVHAVLLAVLTAVTWLTEAGTGQEERRAAVVIEQEQPPIVTVRAKPIEIEAPAGTLAAIEVTTPAPGNLSPIPALGTATDTTKDEPLIGIDVGVGAGAGGSSGHWQGLTGGKGGIGAGAADFFGLKARGRKFIYVVDHSGSMSGKKLDAAKAELLRSMRALKREMEFFVIFYDHQFIPMPGDKPVRATRENLLAASKWIESIAAGGGTDPTGAMLLALSFKPDAIWLLSDGLFAVQAADAIRAANPRAKVQIHCIAFYENAGEPVLRKIAEENRGHYRFVKPGGR